MKNNVAAKLQQELDRITFIAKRKFDRMSPEQQQQVLENIQNMFQYKE